MDPAMIQATWQCGVLGAISNIFGQVITCYQENEPFTLNIAELTQFVLFSVLTCPPNFAWQTWLEKKFPAYPKTPQDGSKEDEDKNKNSPMESPKDDKKLSVRNTGVKFALDQTLGATVNTVFFLAGMDLLRGRSMDAAVASCRDQFWPLMSAGLKLWPAVSITSFLVIPVEHRMTFGSIVGLFWGIYLSLLSSGAH